MARSPRRRVSGLSALRAGSRKQLTRDPASATERDRGMLTGDERRLGRQCPMNEVLRGPCCAHSSNNPGTLAWRGESVASPRRRYTECPRISGDFPWNLAHIPLLFRHFPWNVGHFPCPFWLLPQDARHIPVHMAPIPWVGRRIPLLFACIPLHPRGIPRNGAHIRMKEAGSPCKGREYPLHARLGSRISLTVGSASACMGNWPQ